MRDKLRLYVKLFAISVRSEMQYRASFLMLAVSHFLTTFIDIIAIWVLFDRFKLVKGWTLEEVALIYGILQAGFAIAEMTARGFDKFSDMIKSGDFDRVLLRPLGTIVQVATTSMQAMRLGRFFQGIVVLAWGCRELHVALFSSDTMVIALCIAGTACFFYGLFVLQGALTFWTTETLELMNITTYGGLEAGQYPMSIYPRGFRLFFTFVIPLSCVGYYPIATALRHETLPFALAYLLPAAGLVFLLLSFRFWNVGVRRYRSTGS